MKKVATKKSVENIFFALFFNFSLFEKVKNRKKWKNRLFTFLKSEKSKKCNKNNFPPIFLWQLFSLRQSRISYFTDFLSCLYVNFNENGCDEQSQG